MFNIPNNTYVRLNLSDGSYKGDFKYNSKEIGELLILKGADINAKDIIYQIIL